MKKQDKITIVQGYHAATPSSSLANALGLKYRFAVILHTYNPKVKYIYFQDSVFIEIIKQIAEIVDHDEIEIVMDDDIKFYQPSDLLKYLQEIPEGDRLPPRNVYFKNKSKIICIEETEFWAFSGGPPPYSDSFTASFYTRNNMFHSFKNACAFACKNMGAIIKEVFNGSTTPRKRSWWSKLKGKFEWKAEETK